MVAAPRAQLEVKRVDAALAGRVWRALCYGCALLVALVFFRFEKALVLQVTPRGIQWPAFLLPEVAFVLAFEGLWGMLALALRRRAVWLWQALLVVGHAAVYLLALADHVFFLHTGTRLRLGLVSYAVGNLRMLGGLLASGVDPILTWRLALISALVLLGWSIGRKPSPLIRRPLRAATLVLGAAGFGLLFVHPAPIAPGAGALALSAVPEFLRDAWPGNRVKTTGNVDLIPPDRLYQSPRVETADALAPRPPNLVLLLLESTGAGVVPPYSSPERWSSTPNLAALAARSVVFDRVYTSVPHTSKALVGILCGFYPRLKMPIVESLEGNLPLDCLPRLLLPAGYRTAFLQTALGSFENRPGLIRNLGFQQATFQELLQARGSFGTEGYLGMDEFAMLAPAVHWAAKGGASPYFLTLLTVTTHHPYEVAGEPRTGPSEAQYLRALNHQDRFIGALLDELGKAGALADTVVVIVGDHGEAFGEHLVLQHDVVPYEEVVRVPLLVLGPEERVGPPRRVPGLRHHFDLVPTLLGLAGVRWRGVLPGRDLFAFEGHERVFSFCWYERYCAAMHEGNLSFVYHYGRRPTEVFDVVSDPDERADLVETISADAISDAERRIIAEDLSIGAFYAQFPTTEGPELWWVNQVQPGSR